MKVIYPSGTGGNPFDRNALFLHKSFQGQIPAGQEDYALQTYTVPASRKAIITNLQVSAFVVNPPAVSDQLIVYIQMRNGASSWLLSYETTFTQTMEKRLSTVMIHDMYLDPGTTIDVLGTNLAADGTVSAYVTFEGLEFE